MTSRVVIHASCNEGLVVRGVLFDAVERKVHEVFFVENNEVAERVIYGNQHITVGEVPASEAQPQGENTHEN